MEYSAYSTHLKKQTNFIKTENNSVALKSSLNACVDFFYATLQTPEDYYSLFLSALAENRMTAMKILFWHRDIRSTGMGRRTNFRYVMSKVDEWKWPGQDFTTAAILHYGRADDLLSLLDTSSGKHALQEISKQLKAENALVAKWMPRESSKKKNYRFYARRIANWMGWTSKQYRKNISSLTSVVEQQMVNRDWDNIDFNHVPSQASLRYKNCFARNTTNYSEWQQSLLKKDTLNKVNVATLLPHQIVAEYTFSPSTRDDTLEAMWSALPKVETNCLVIADTSGSMHGTPLQVSVALGLYFAERNPYKGFITFSQEPQWHSVHDGDNLYFKLNAIKSINCTNTNMEATFQLLLESYQSTQMMPETLLIVSDMQFDEAIGSTPRHWRQNTISKTTFFDKMKSKFASLNIPFPKVVFWNVREDSKGIPVSFDETGTALISGYNPSIMQSIMDCEDLSPTEIMNKAIKNINPNL